MFAPLRIRNIVSQALSSSILRITSAEHRDHSMWTLPPDVISSSGRRLRPNGRVETSITPADGLTTTVITSFDELLALETSWKELWRCSGGTYAQAFETCAAAWHELVAPRGGTLCVIACRDEDDLVAIWPLSRTRKGFWRLLHQVGPMVGGFPDILVANHARRESYLAAVWRCAQRMGVGDILVLSCVNVTTRLHELLATNRLAGANPHIAPYIAWRDGEQWNEYYASLSAGYRKVQNKKRRQLEKKGDLRFEIVDDMNAIPDLVRWMFVQKRALAQHNGKRAAWIYAAEFEQFLIRLATSSTWPAKCVVYKLSLDGEILAAQLAMEGPNRVEWITASFSAAHSHHSPGMVLNEFCLRDACGRRLDVEFGSGNEESKLFWCRNISRPIMNYHVPFTWWGRLGLAVDKVRASTDIARLASPMTDRYRKFRTQSAAVFAAYPSNSSIRLGMGHAIVVSLAMITGLKYP